MHYSILYHLSPASSCSVRHSSALLIDLSIWLPFYSSSVPQLSSLVSVSILIIFYILTSVFLFTLSLRAFLLILFLSPTDLAILGTQLTSWDDQAPGDQGQSVLQSTHVFLHSTRHVHLNTTGFAMLVREEPSVASNQNYLQHHWSISSPSH